MSVFTALLFVKPRYRSHACRFFMCYFFFVAWSNDTLTYKVLHNWTDGLIAMAVQFPLMGLIYAYCIYMISTNFYFHEIRLTIYILGFGLVSWIIDRFFCDGIDELSFFHMNWHVFGTYGNLLLMCLGLKFNGFELEGHWFPKVVRKPSFC